MGNLLLAYRTVRSLTERLCQPLEPEDYVIQSMPEASPPKWHLAHTSWFFEQFLLSEARPAYAPYRPEYAFLFNSYYKSVGPHFERSRRGLLSRPGVAEILRYRKHVDEAVEGLLSAAEGREPGLSPRLRAIVELGLNHEQQHQELLVTDIKHLLCTQPLRPAYRSSPASEPAPPRAGASSAPLRFEAGLHELGAPAQGFAFDNERPRHRVFLEPFSIDAQPVTQGEYLAFVEAGGYAEPSHWLSDGWDRVQKERWTSPLYWEKQGHDWWTMTLAGPRPLDPREPACHLSYYEADAYARWRGARLPTEAESEVAATAAGVAPRAEDFADGGRLHPRPLTGETRFFGGVWEWTASAYLPYPGFRPLEASLGEYNGKFMSGQMVLRGGSCATPLDHFRISYRNFFPPEARWQFTGLRLARGPKS